MHLTITRLILIDVGLDVINLGILYLIVRRILRFRGITLGKFGL